MGTETQFDFVENGSITSPLGFLACGVIAGLKKNKAPDLAMIESETACSFAATFTTNLFPAAPVQYDREICANSPKVRAVVANSGVANACTGLDGYNNAKKMAELTAAALSVPVQQVMIASTGRIGVQLPMDIIENGINEAAKSLTHNGGSSAARAIMTTDTRPKELAVSFAVLGAQLGLLITGETLSIYAQLGMVMLIGLAAKNAILMVEFSKQERESGRSVFEAAMNGANLRYRAVLMTAWSFLFGVFPLVIATGAGSGSRRAIGITTFSGMVVATLVGIIFTPALYAAFQRIREQIKGKLHLSPSAQSLEDAE